MMQEEPRDADEISADERLEHLHEIGSRIENTGVQPHVIEHPPYVSTGLDDEILPMPHDREDLEMLSVYTDVYDPVAEALHEDGDVILAAAELKKRWPGDVNESLALDPLLPDGLEKYANELLDALTD